MGLKLQVELQDLRRMLKEKCEDIINDPKLAYEFYWRFCDIEEDNRFVVVDDDSKEDYVSVPYSWLVKFCTCIEFKEPMSDAEREKLWKQKLKQQFGIEIIK